MDEVIITSSLLIVMILFVRRIFKGRLTLKLQYALWLLVVIRLILPFSFIESPVSIMNYVRLPDKIIIADADNKEASAKHPQAVVDETTINEGSYTEDLTADSGEFSSSIIIKYIWYLGIIVTALYMIASNVFFAKKLIRSRKEIKDYSCKLPIYTSDAISSPCLFWGFKGTGIYITPSLTESPEEMSHVIAHELSHYYNFDHFWALVRNILLAVYWFNPLVWIAAYISRQDCELACDEAAIKRIGEGERFAYGRTLIGLIPMEKPVKSMLSIATTMNTDKRNLKERITMIAKKPRMLISTFLSIMLIIAVAVGCTFTGGRDSNNADKLASEFLKKIYEVESHDRYENYLEAFNEYNKPLVDSYWGGRKAGVYSIGEEAGEEIVKEYTNIYAPLMTEKAFEDMITDTTLFFLDSLAYHNNFTSEAKVIHLAQTKGSGEAAIYDYRVDLEIISDGEKETLELEGIIQLEKNEEGKYKVSFFTLDKRALYERFGSEF
ncbi:MAG: M56 family metallopeptidase [Clostridiaceae bacterium]